MLKSWPGYLPAFAASAVTLILTALFAATIDVSVTPGPIQGLLVLLVIPVPLVVAVIWGSALLAGRPLMMVLAGAVLWFGLSYSLLPRDIVWQMAGNVAAGITAGLALGLRWRLDVALAALALVLLPIIVWSLVQMPVEEQFEAFNADMLKALEETLPGSASEEQKAQALAEYERKLVSVTGPVGRIVPFLIGVGVLTQGGILLLLVWLAAGRLGIAIPGWRFPPFDRWRVPFYWVWLLVAGIGLLLTRLEQPAYAGLNIALLAATVLSVQGTAVQWRLTSRLLSKTGRLLYWVTNGILFLPLVVLGVGLGLADQWIDLRRLDDDSGQAGETPDDADDIE